MIKSRGIIDLHKSFEKGVQNIFQVASLAIILGNIIEIFFTYHKDIFIRYTDIPTICITSIILLLYYLKKIHYKLGFTILVYNALIIVILGIFLSDIELTNPLRLNFFLRDSLFIILLLTVASFSLNKIHAFIIGIAYLITCIAFRVVIKSQFLNDNIVVIVIIISTFLGLIYYLVGMFEKALLEQHERHIYIKEQNDILNEANYLLNERQQFIARQSEELRIQKNELQTKNEELNELNATKDKFFSIIAHDIKNPFTTIMGFSELLIRNYELWTDEKKLNVMRVLFESSNKLYELLENLLQWSLSQRGLLEYHPLKKDLSSTINSILKLMKHSADEKEIKFEIDIPENNLCIYADERLLDIILRNLIGNAIKFTPKDGLIEIKAEAKDNFAHISIIDNGIGISPESIQNLFRIDVHNTDVGTNKEKGTGLGLILVKEFVARQSGNIWVKSEVGKGSEFVFSLPLG
jgi:signal transduction histidine kinase